MLIMIAVFVAFLMMGLSIWIVDLVKARRLRTRRQRSLEVQAERRQRQEEIFRRRQE